MGIKNSHSMFIDGRKWRKVEFETKFHTGLQHLRRRKRQRKKFYYLIVIFDAHTERVDEDGQ